MFIKSKSYLLIVFPENLGGISFSQSYFGFYDSCELPSLDSLKQDGTYYFEVDSSNFADEETTKVNLYNICGQLNIFTESKDTFMNINYSSRQQYATYKKINTLPQDVQEYLEKKGIKLK